MQILDIIIISLLIGLGVWFIIWALNKAMDELTK